MTSAVLTLNAGMIPVGTVSVRTAVKLVFEEIAHSVQDTDRVLRSPSTVFPVPSIVRIPRLTHVPEKHVVFSNLNVIYRDDQVCQYCGGRGAVDELTVDHVVPRSRFAAVARVGRLKYSVNSWENCVASCAACNAMKDDRLPEEAGLRLRRIPKEPAFRPHVVVTRSEAARRNWLEFLEPFQRFTVLLLT